MLKEVRYDVLIICSHESITQAIAKNLIDNPQFNTPTLTSDPMNARRLLIERHFDIVIINSPLEHESGLNLALEINDQHEVGIILLAKSNNYDELFDKTNELGIITLSKPTPSSLFTQSLKILCLTRQKLANLKKHSSSEMSLKEKIKEIQLVNEAKIILMKHRSITEDEAHHIIERKAMNERISKRNAARAIINEYRN